MSEANRILLGVNVDHVATLRQARGTRYPDPVDAALLAERAGADSITVHLREDRRHIQERDLRVMADVLQTMPPPLSGLYPFRITKPSRRASTASVSQTTTDIAALRGGPADTVALAGDVKTGALSFTGVMVMVTVAVSVFPAESLTS